MKFRSKYEKRIWDELGKKQDKVDYEPQKPVIRYNAPHTYIPDFVIKKNGIIVEAKGYLRPVDRSKMRLIKKQNPSLDIRFLFMNANKRLTKSPNSLMYWEWCERHDFPWSEGDKIPEEWFNE